LDIRGADNAGVILADFVGGEQRIPSLYKVSTSRSNTAVVSQAQI